MPYKEIKELFFHNDLLNTECIISINLDGCKSAFLFAQTYNKYEFILNDKYFLEAKNKDNKDEVLGTEMIEDKLKIIWTKKSFLKLWKEASLLFLNNI